MAKGNLILGTMAGKLGDVVAYNYNGKQAARVRRRTIANPKSAKQAIQRAIAASVAKFVSAFAPVLNNSLQSEQTKVKTLAKIRGLNMNFLRQLAATGNGTYCPKGAMYVAPNDYLISRGTLAGLTPNKSKTESVLLTRGAIALDASQFMIEEYGPIHPASYHFPTIAVGDQITVLASATEDVTEGSKNGYCRFAFKDDTTQAFITAEGSLRKLNPAAIDTSKAAGDWQNLRFAFLSDADGDFGLVFFGALVGESADSPLASACAGIIVSREAGKLRSNAHMVSLPDTDWTLDEVYPSYMDGGTAIDMPSENYLDNNAEVTNYFAHLPSALPYAVSIAEGSRRLVKLSTNVPLDNNVKVALTITRGGAEDAKDIPYNGSAQLLQDVDVTVQWLANGYLELEGDAGDVTITAGFILFNGSRVNLD